MCNVLGQDHVLTYYCLHYTYEDYCNAYHINCDINVISCSSTLVCVNFGENRSRNATMRVLADGQIHRLTDANRFYNLSHAICYSYGTDNYNFQ